MDFEFIPKPNMKIPIIKESLQQLQTKSKDVIISQIAKVFLETVTNLQDPLLILSPINQNMFIQLLDAILQHKEPVKMLPYFLDMVSPDVLQTETLSLIISSLISIIPYVRAGDPIVPPILAVFKNLHSIELYPEVYSLLVTTLYDLYIAMYPNAPGASDVKTLIQELLENAMKTPTFENGLPPIVILLHLSCRYASENWISPHANHFELTEHEYSISISSNLRMMKDFKMRQEKKMAFVETLSEENKSYSNTRAHTHAIKCISLLLSLADHQLIEKYDLWKKPLIDCFIVNGYTTDVSKFIPTVKLFITLISSQTLHVKGLSVVFERLYLYILQSPYATPQQKQLTLEMICSLTEKSECIVEMFQLYDCSYSAPSVIKTLLKILVDIVFGKINLQEEQEFVSKQFDLDNKLRSLKCVIRIINAITSINNYNETPSGKIQERLERKVLLYNGFPIFKNNSKEGIEYFQHHGFCGKSKKEIAEFLLATEGLDKKEVTDVLTSFGDDGRNALDNMMKEIDFSGELIDTSLQKMFWMFCAPGEIQLVDNFIIRFSERYVECNPEREYTADQVYIVVTSVICLALDSRHRKITFNKFCEMVESAGKMNIDLKGLYDRTSKGTLNIQDCITGLDVETTKDLDMKEKVLRTLSGIDSNMIRLYQTKEKVELEKSVDVLKNMVKYILTPCTDICRYCFFNGETSEFIEGSLKCIQNLIHITATLGLPECDDLTSDLSLWTMLLKPEEMKPKHVLAIRYVFTICKEDGIFLKSAWLACLKVLSHLDQLGLLPLTYGKVTEIISVPKHQHAIYYPEYKDCFTYVNDNLRQSLKTFDEKTLVTLKQLLQKQLDVLEDIFCKQAVAPSENFVCFLQAMNEVIMNDINSFAPQYFLFNILLQVLLMATGRDTNEMNDALNVACEIYTKAGLHPHELMGSQSVKALTALHSKFPTHPKSLQGLMTIMADSTNEDVRDMIISSVETMIEDQNTIQFLDWTTCIRILNLAAIDECNFIVSHGFSLFRLLTLRTFEGDNKELILKGLQLYAHNCVDEKMGRDLITITKMMSDSEQTLNPQLLPIWSGLISSKFIGCSLEATKYLFEEIESTTDENILNLLFTQITPSLFKDLEKKDKDWVTTIGLTYVLHLNSFITQKKVPMKYIEIPLNICHKFTCSTSQSTISVSSMLIKEIIDTIAKHSQCSEAIPVIKRMIENHTEIILETIQKQKQEEKKSKNKKQPLSKSYGMFDDKYGDIIGTKKCSQCQKECSEHMMFQCQYCFNHYYCSNECRSQNKSHELVEVVNEYKQTIPTDVKTLLTFDLKVFLLLNDELHEIANNWNANEFLTAYKEIILHYSTLIAQMKSEKDWDSFWFVCETATDGYISFILESELYSELNQILSMDTSLVMILIDKLLKEHKSILQQIKKEFNISQLPNCSQSKRLKALFDKI